MPQWYKKISRHVKSRLKSRHAAHSDLHSAPTPISNAGIYPDSLSSATIKVIEQLQRANHEAYVVGGCIRDLLLNGKPKDFDVATSATPEQVRSIFRNSRIIGRRFKIVHVRFGRELIEVTTFRANHAEGNKKTANQAESGMLLRDNVFGNLASDAVRRDFTINAFYYDPIKNELFDYAQGIKDIKQRKIRIIGDAETRYREDPVRMIRALRFAARLDFELEEKTAAPIRSLAPLFEDIAPARLFDEILKLLAAGHGHPTLLLLQEYKLFGQFFPDTQISLDKDKSGFYQRFIEQALRNTDERINSGKHITPAFLLAALLWPAMRDLMLKLERSEDGPQVALNKAANIVLDREVKRIAIPRRFSSTLREIWEQQLRLPRRGGSRAYRMLEHPRFRAAYDFTLLREQAGEDLQGLGQWWTDFQTADEEQRKSLVDGLFNKKRRSRKKNPSQ